jgi:acetylornithine/N-succinyldiaminopimelate aminotransferase
MENLLLTHPKSIGTIIRAKDQYYFDVHGKRYIDLESGIWCTSLGHSHDTITDIMKVQLDTHIHSGTMLIPDYIDNIAAKILKKTHIEGKVLFLSSGSEAIEFAVNSAKLKNPQGMLTTFTDNFVTSYGQAKEITQKIDIWTCLQCQEEDCDTNCHVLRDKIPENTIFIFDPFCFSRAILEPPAKLIHTIETELRNKNGILILDEVTTGLGRTGKWFGYEHFDLQPDIVVLGKTLGNGYPVSCAAIDKTIVQKIEQANYRYAQSHQNDPLGCKIAEAVIDTLEKEQLVERSHKVGNELITRLRNELHNNDGVIETRGKGLLIGIELHKAISVENIYKRLLQKNIIIGFSLKFNVLNIFPPYTLDEGNIPEIVGKIKESIHEENSVIRNT